MKHIGKLLLLVLLAACGKQVSVPDASAPMTQTAPAAAVENSSPTLLTAPPADSPDKGTRVDFKRDDLQAIRTLQVIVTPQGILRVAPNGNANWTEQASDAEWRAWAHRWQAMVQHGSLPPGDYKLHHWPRGMNASTTQTFHLREEHKALLRAALWDGLHIHPKRPFGSENEDIDIADILGEHYDVDAAGNPQLSAAQQRANWKLMRELPLAAQALIEYGQLSPGPYTVYYLNPETP